jgi:8-amino-7-oxononanoate synthase
LYDRLKELGFKLGPTLSPIIAALFERREVAIAFWNGLLEQGVYVNMILPPAAPEGGSLLRCSISAAHTEEQIDRIVEAFASVQAVTESPRQV